MKNENIEFVSRLYGTSKDIFITFDDGYVDNYEVMFPLVSRLCAKVTVYPVTSSLGGSHYFGRSTPYTSLTKEMITDMSKSGYVEFGSHTHTHTNLTTLSVAQLEYEIEKSKNILEELTGKRVTTFSYPFSIFDPRVPRLLEKNGFDLAVGGTRGYVNSDSPRYDLPRWGVSRKTGNLSFRLKVKGVISLI